MVDVLSTTFDTSDVPNRNLTQSEFRTAMDAYLAKFPGFAAELATMISQVNTEIAGNEAVAWNTLTGAKSPPLVVTHNSAVWVLLTSVADITATTPSVTNTDWASYSYPSGIEEEKQALTLSAGAATWNWSSGPTATVTLDANATITLSGFASGDVHQSATLITTQNGTGGYTLGFAGATILTDDGGAIPAPSSGAGDIDLWTLSTWDNGTNVFVARAGRNLA